MDRLTEFVSKSFTGAKQGDGSENNNIKSPFSSIDMSKATLDKEAHLLGRYGDTDIDIDALSEKDGINSEPSPLSAESTDPSSGPVSTQGLISVNTSSAAPLPTPSSSSSSSAQTLSTSSALSSHNSRQQPGGVGMSLPHILQSSSAVTGAPGGHRPHTIANISTFSIDSLSARVSGDNTTCAPPPAAPTSASITVCSSTVVTSTTPAPSAARTLTSPASSHSLHQGK